jgi:O-antigen ligase
MTAMIPIYYLFLRTGIKPRSFWFGIAIGAVASAIYAILFVYVWHANIVDIRARGPVHPIPFGDISLALGFISMAGFRYFEDMHPTLVVIPLVALTSGIFAAFLSGTRGALIAIPLLTVLFLVQMGRHPRYRTYRLVILTVLLALLLGAYYFPGSSAKTRIHSMITVTKQYFSGRPDLTLKDTQQRLVMWAQAWEMIRQHPILGVGRDGFHRIIKEKRKTDPILQAVVDRESPHNMYLTAWTAYGLGGLIVVLGVFLSPLLIFLPAMRRDGPVRELAYAGVMVVAAFMQFALTESIFYRNINITFYIVLTAAALALIRLNENRTYKRDHI